MTRRSAASARTADDPGAGVPAALAEGIGCRAEGRETAGHGPRHRRGHAHGASDDRRGARPEQRALRRRGEDARRGFQHPSLPLKAAVAHPQKRGLLIARHRSTGRSRR